MNGAISEYHKNLRMGYFELGSKKHIANTLQHKESHRDTLKSTNNTLATIQQRPGNQTQHFITVFIIMHHAEYQYVLCEQSICKAVL